MGSFSVPAAMALAALSTEETDPEKQIAVICDPLPMSAAGTGGESDGTNVPA